MPVGVQYPSSSSLGVFHSLISSIGYNHVSSLQPTYRHPFGRPFTYSLFRRVSRLGTGSGNRCCGPRGTLFCNFPILKRINLLHMATQVLYRPARSLHHVVFQLIAVLRRLSDVLQGRVCHTSPEEIDTTPLRAFQLPTDLKPIIPVEAS